MIFSQSFNNSFSVANLSKELSNFELETTSLTELIHTHHDFAQLKSPSDEMSSNKVSKFIILYDMQIISFLWLKKYIHIQ